MSLANQFNTKPLYQQVADEFIARIVSGAWQPGQAIENEADLARSLGISLGTVRKAFEILTEYDLLERHQGKGTIIADQIGTRSRFSNIRDRGGERVSGEYSISNVSLENPDVSVAELLSINVRTPVLAFRRARRHEGRTFMLERVYLRVDASTHDLGAEDLERLAQSRWTNLDLAVGKRETVSVEACDREEAELLGLQEGDMALMLERVIYSHRGKPLELRRALCNLGKNLFYVSS